MEMEVSPTPGFTGEKRQTTTGGLDLRDGGWYAPPWPQLQSFRPSARRAELQAGGISVFFFRFRWVCVRWVSLD